jgi:hypothetical protein
MIKQIFYVSIVSFAFLFTVKVEAQNQVKPVPMDHRVKAAFLVKFIKYIDWPGSNKGTFKMGVFGDSPIAGNLFTLMPKVIDGWKLEITKIQNVEESLDCHLVFLSSSEKDRYTGIVNALKDSSVLTVSDTQNFLDLGGMINFLILEQMVRFEINLKATKKVGLKVSSKLLRLAKFVRK